MRLKLLLTFFVFLLVAAQCNTQPEKTQGSTGEKLNVVATTSIVGDIVKNVGGVSQEGRRQEAVLQRIRTPTHRGFHRARGLLQRARRRLRAALEHGTPQEDGSW